MGYSAAVIGTGAPSNDTDPEGCAMGYLHGEGYQRDSRCELTACADVRPKRATRFGEEFSVTDKHVYSSHERLLDEQVPDVVSICVPPADHADIVADCARAGVRAVHCEKPMAKTWRECREMAKIARETEMWVAVNHQRRFGEPFRRANRLLEDGRIGDLRRVEFAADNLYDYGSHSFDLCGHFVGDKPPAWVLGQIHYTEANMKYEAHNENQAVVAWEYEDGTAGFASTGQSVGYGVVGCHHRLLGTDGRIEIGVGFPARYDGPTLRIVDDQGTQTVPVGEGTYSDEQIYRAVAATIEWLDGGPEPPHAIENALLSTSLVFGAWESARRQGRVEFPLDIEDNPLEAMVADETYTP